MPTLSNTERQARQRQAYERDVMRQQIASLEAWVQELQQKVGLPVRQLLREAPERD